MHITECFFPDVLKNAMLTECICNSMVYSPQLARSSYTCGSLGYDARFLLLSAFGTTLGLCLGVFIGSSLRYVIKHVLPHKNLIIYLVLARLLSLIFTRSTVSTWPHLCIWESHQFRNVKLAFQIVLSLYKLLLMD